MSKLTVNDVDLDYFRRFNNRVMESRASQEEVYCQIQSSHTGDLVAAGPLIGLEYAIQHVPNDASILLVGCGAGTEAQWLIERGYSKITGLDIDPALLGKFETEFDRPTICADICKSGIDTNAFDVVLTHRSLHHLFYPFAALKELGRIARTTVCIADEPVKSYLKKTLKAITGGNQIISDANIYEYQFDFDDVHRYMLFAGYRAVFMRRFWLSGRLSQNSLSLLNKLLYPGGNRFCAIFKPL